MTHTTTAPARRQVFLPEHGATGLPAGIIRFLTRVIVGTFYTAAGLSLAALVTQASFGPWMLMPGFVLSVILWASLSLAVFFGLVSSAWRE